MVKYTVDQGKAECCRVRSVRKERASEEEDGVLK